MNKQKLPEGWKEIELGDIFEFQKKSKIKAGEGLGKGKYKFFTSSDKQTKFIDHYNQNGEFLIFATGGHAGIHYCNEKFATSTDCFVTNVSGKILTKYVYYYLYGQIDLLEAGFRGAGLRHISKKYIQEMKIFFPENKKTQKKIVSILEKTEKSKEWRKEADGLTKDFLKSVFFEMFGDPASNEKNWEKIPTINVCNCIVPGRDKPKSFTGDVPWITTNDLNHLWYTRKSKNNIGLTKNEIKKVNARIIPSNSVIMTCVGELGIVSITQEDLVMNQQLHAFTCSKKINPIFLTYNLSFQKGYMHKMATSTTVPYMNKTTCNNTPTILPPIELQNKFASIVKKVEAIKEHQKQSKDQIDNLFNVLMQKAFRGELII